ncbi:MAG: formate--tetrahydrofolate ligase [Planctomycetes bacterium]|nr:formate--tetrahydrofolate ligase [Planctomycetota bacterium]
MQPSEVVSQRRAHPNSASPSSLPILTVAKRLGLSAEDVELYGDERAKIKLRVLHETDGGSEGKLIVVSAMTPTTAGEGKTTTTIGLGDALSRLGHRTVIALREPSLGPCLGNKGGACGGGFARVIPSEEINLHFNGDFHAITTAHNLLAAVLDNHLHQGNALAVDSRAILWRRVMDMNDRALRQIVVGLGGKANGVPRQDGFDITVSSEVMAILCLAQGLGDLKTMLGEMVVAESLSGTLVRARDLGVCGAMAAILKDAIKPNLVRTLEGTPALIHGGPFANIAHGCNSLLATRLALKLADYVVTEAGFGTDLGLEKFVHIKCRKGGLRPSAAVIVASIRALKAHGAAPGRQPDPNGLDAVLRGFSNLDKHVENARILGFSPVVAINRFADDTGAEIDLVKDLCTRAAVPCGESTAYARGGLGGEELARLVIDAAQRTPSPPRFLYDLEDPLVRKIESVASKIYGASEVRFAKPASDKLRKFQERGYGRLPVCMAKTQYSFTDNPKIVGRPAGFTLTVQDVHLRAGAGFVVALAGDIMTMPGLGKSPAALDIDVDEEGRITGLS